MFSAILMVAAAVVLDDLGAVDRTASSFWDVTEHVGVTVDEGASASLPAFDAGGPVSAPSLGTDLETRRYDRMCSEAIPFNSRKIDFVLFFR